MKCMIGNNGREYLRKNNPQAESEFDTNSSPMLVGQVVGAIPKIEPAGEIVHRIAREAIVVIRQRLSKL